MGRPQKASEARPNRTFRREYLSGVKRTGIGVCGRLFSPIDEMGKAVAKFYVCAYSSAEVDCMVKFNLRNVTAVFKISVLIVFFEVFMALMPTWAAEAPHL